MLTRNREIIFVLLIAAVLRLYHITFPIAGWHSWRQADTAAIARNFATEEFDITKPRIDWRGITPGYVESEFQLYTILTASVYSVIGVHEAVGRSLSLLCSVGSILFLFLFVRKYYGQSVAIWSAAMYAVLPLNVYYGRTFMPEQMMLFFSVSGLFVFSEWLDHRKWWMFVLSAALISLAALLKLPALYLGLPLLFLSYLTFGRRTLLQWPLIVFAIVVFSVNAVWYFHAHQLKLMTGLSFGIWDAGTDKWGNWQLLTSWKFYNDIILKSLAERHFTYPGFILFVIGLSYRRSSIREYIIDSWLIAVMIYMLIVARGNQVHEYYQLPLMLPGVVYIGKVLGERFPTLNIFMTPLRRSGVVLLTALMVMMVLSLVRMYVLYRGETSASPVFGLAAYVQAHTNANDLVVSASDCNPVVLYNCNRRGWVCSVDGADEGFLSQRRREGARYIIIDKQELHRSQNGFIRNMMNASPPAFENENFVMFGI